MWWIFFFFLFGIAVGFYFNKKTLLNFSEITVSWVVYSLLFMLGIGTGSNKKLISDFPSIGFEAMIIAFGAIAGSFVFSYFWEKLICSAKDLNKNEQRYWGNGKIHIMGSIYVVLFFVSGILIALFGAKWFTSFFNGEIITYTLYFLLFFVGLSIGSDRLILQNIKQMKKRLIIFPIITVLGTLIGSLLVSFLINGVNIFDALAVGSGFGYYSLSSIIIAELKGNRLATIALIANIIREVFTILFAPFIYSIFGRFALISSGGATSMDTTLPVILRLSGKEAAIISVYHGIVLTIAVPFLVTFFSQL